MAGTPISRRPSRGGLRVIPRGAIDFAATALAAAYVLLPNAHHPVLAGIPLGVVGAGALVVALTRLAFPKRTARRRVAVVLAAICLVKLGTAVVLPGRGFEAEYFPNAEFRGTPIRSIDHELTFDARTFPREFFNEPPYWTAMTPETLPFAVRWRGVVALSAPTMLAIDARASEPVTVTFDGGPLPATPVVGMHTVEVVFARRTPAPPALEVAIRKAGSSGPRMEPVPVFTRPLAPGHAAFARVYRWLANGLDVMVLVGLMGSLAARSLTALAAARSRGWLPPFGVAALLVLTFYFALGAVRAWPHLDMMEFQQRGDDWLYYEGTARYIASGTILGTSSRIYSSTVLYPYFVAALHILLGPRLWAVYFGQHVTLGLACVAFGWLGVVLWGQHRGLAVLASAAVIGLLDVTRWYSIRLIPENFAIVVVPLAFLALYRHLRRPGVVPAAVAGAGLGAAVLARLNLLTFAPFALGYLVLLRHADTPRPGIAPKVALVAGFVLTFALYPLRDYLAAGAWGVLPSGAIQTYAFQEGSLLERWHESWWSPIRHIVLPDLAFLLGYPKLAHADFSIRPHWMILWGTYLVWVWSRRHERPAPFVWLLHTYVAIYVGVMSLNAYIWSYGYRYLLPLVFVLGIFFPPGVAAVVDWVRTAWAARRGLSGTGSRSVNRSETRRET
jgi:hypothetical protein